MSEQTAVITVHADRGDPLLPFLNPLRIVRTAWRHRELLSQLTRREVVGRYRGSHLGVLWALLTPMMTLAVFTLVFGAMNRGGWAEATYRGPLSFPMNLFIGIILFGVFSEVANRAATLITTNPNFVKKAVFPVELLVVSVLLGSIVHALMTLLIELAVVWFALGYIPWTAWLLPVAFIPASLMTLGVCWALAALGVFFRDLSSAVGPVVQLLFFMTPIVYPMSIMAEYPRVEAAVRLLNPFVTIVESARLMLIEGKLPDFAALGWATLGSAVVALAGYALFMKVRRYFADAM